MWGTDMQIVAIRFAESEVTEFQRSCIATQFMASRIVAPVVDAEAECRPEVHEALATFMQETWPVHSNVESFCQVRDLAISGIYSCSASSPLLCWGRHGALQALSACRRHEQCEHIQTKGRGGRNKRASICVTRVSDCMHMGNTCLSFSLTVLWHL